MELLGSRPRGVGMGGAFRYACRDKPCLLVWLWQHAPPPPNRHTHEYTHTPTVTPGPFLVEFKSIINSTWKTSPSIVKRYQQSSWPNGSWRIKCGLAWVQSQHTFLMNVKLWLTHQIVWYDFRWDLVSLTDTSQSRYNIVWYDFRWHMFSLTLTDTSQSRYKIVWYDLKWHMMFGLVE